MINYTEKSITILEKDSVTCDICKTVYSDPWEIQEFHSIDRIGGYGSVFGDSVRIVCDICQYCLKNMIKDSCYIETTEGLKKYSSEEGEKEARSPGQSSRI